MKHHQTAKKSKFRVVGYDSFSNEDWKVGEYWSLDKAKEQADKRAGTMTLMYVYDDKGKLVYSAGSY